jgi:hypothetical protein
MRYRRFRKHMLNGHPGNVSRAVKRAIVRGVNAGLVVTSTTDGVHSPTSLHSPSGPLRRGRAVDLGLRPSEVGTIEGRRKLRAHQRSEFRRFRSNPTRFRELIGPVNDRVVLRARHAPLPEGSGLEDQHDDHLHVAPRW